MKAKPANRIFPQLAGAAVLLFALSFHTELAKACSVCFSATDEAREAYYLTTVIMMGVPLLLLAGIGFWLYRSLAKQRAQAQPNPFQEKP